MKDTRDYDRIEKQLLEIVKAHLEELVKADKKIGAYSDQIQIDLVLNTDVTNRELPDRQQYRFSVTAAYTDDDGNTTSEEPFEQEAVLQKIIPTPVVQETSRLNYGKPVGESVFSDDGKGVAQYVNKDLGLEIPVSGAFSWKETEKGKVPFGRNNGMEKSQYTAIFTPDETMADVFAPAECLLDVKTQIGLYLTGTADDRVYHYDEGKGSADISCTGTVTLVYAKEDGSADTEKFTEVSELLSAGTWTLDNGNIGKRKATYQGFALDTDKNSDGMYYLINQKITYQITVTPQNKVIQTSPVTTEQTSYEYGTKLNNIGLNQTDVRLQYADGNWVSGTSSWAGSVDTNTVPNAGTSNYPITFTPDTKYQGGYGTYTHASYTAAVVIDKKKVEIPTVSDKTYNGATQTSGLSETETYTILQDVGGKNATDQPYVTLQLRDKENYVWASKNADGTYTEQGSENYKITYQIQKADLQLKKSGNASILPLLYGQYLTDEKNPGQENVQGNWVQKNLSAEQMLKGYRVAYKGISGLQGANRIWKWEKIGDLVSSQNGDLQQPLSVGKYQIKISFRPEDSDNLNEYVTYLPVNVEKSLPLVKGKENLKANSMYQAKDVEKNSLKSGGAVLITNEVTVYNRYTGGRIYGTWNWSEPDAIPQWKNADSNNEVTQSVTFYPSSYANNYSNVSGITCKVPLRTTLNVRKTLVYKGKESTLLYPASSMTNGLTNVLETVNHENWMIMKVEVIWQTPDGEKRATAKCKNPDNVVSVYDPENFMSVERKKENGLWGVYITFTGVYTRPRNDVRVIFTMGDSSDFTSSQKSKKITMEAQTETEMENTETELQISVPETTMSDSESITSEPSVPETTMPESQTTETTAPESQIPETEPPQTQAIESVESVQNSGDS